jgi:hypothetical protein
VKRWNLACVRERDAGILLHTFVVVFPLVSFQAPF